jgi:hypothetical protein
MTRGQRFESSTAHHISVFELRQSEEQIERLLVAGFDHMAIAHVDLVEDGRVEELAGSVACLAVGEGTAGGEPEGEVHHLLPVVEARLDDGLPRLDDA